MDDANFLQEFSMIIEPDHERREICDRCGRPCKVCICSYLPSQKITLQNTTFHILQHPNEENRPLHTVAILKAALSADSCVIYKGRRFGKQVCPDLHNMLQLQRENTFLLYPGNTSTDLSDIVTSNEVRRKYNILLLDGTWKQASSIYTQNEFLHCLTKVQLKPDCISEYVIRTQPTNESLSTVECAAYALEHTEDIANIKEILLKPLRGLCQFQLDHGAAIHQSKEMKFSANSDIKT